MFYWKNDSILAGTTLKNPLRWENNSMALHCHHDPELVVENRKSMCDTLHIPLARCTFANQTHSDHICHIDALQIGKGAYTKEDAIADCDALYTRIPEVLIGVFHADCVPILLYEEKQKLICAIHSGWKGTQKQITTKTIQHLITHEHCDPHAMHAYIGPSIAFEHFEVGEEVVAGLEKLPFSMDPYKQKRNAEKYEVDNAGINHEMLRRMGIPETQITCSSMDTYTDPQCFSYRKDKACGRHLSFIMMTR